MTPLQRIQAALRVLLTRDVQLSTEIAASGPRLAVVERTVITIRGPWRFAPGGFDTTPGRILGGPDHLPRQR